MSSQIKEQMEDMNYEDVQVMAFREYANEHDIGYKDLNRYIHGVHVPKLTLEMLQILWEDPYAVWLRPYYYDIYNTLFLTYEGQRCVRSVINSSFKCIAGADDWWKKIRKLAIMPNGQEKNFLVALRTGFPPKRRLMVLLRGSKADQSGGIWHEFYGYYLLFSADFVEIHCYDYGEKKGEEEYKVDGKKTLLIKRFSTFYDGDVSHYDIVVDDVYYQGRLAKLPGVCKHYSSKGGSSKFFHISEPRTFTFELEKKNFNCCKKCNMLRDLSLNEEMYFYSKLICCLLGSRPCADNISTDIFMKGILFRELLAGKRVHVETPIQIRAMLSLIPDMPINYYKGDISKGKKYLHVTEWIHGEGFPVSKAPEVILEGGVRLVGIDANDLKALTIKSKTEIVISQNVSAVLRMGPQLCVTSNQIPGYKCVKQAGEYAVQEKEFLNEEWLSVLTASSVPNLMPRFSYWEGVDLRQIRDLRPFFNVPGVFRVTEDQMPKLMTGPLPSGKKTDKPGDKLWIIGNTGKAKRESITPAKSTAFMKEWINMKYDSSQELVQISTYYVLDVDGVFRVDKRRCKGKCEHIHFWTDGKHTKFNASGASTKMLAFFDVG